MLGTAVVGVPELNICSWPNGAAANINGVAGSWIDDGVEAGCGVIFEGPLLGVRKIGGPGLNIGSWFDSTTTNVDRISLVAF